MGGLQQENDPVRKASIRCFAARYCSSEGVFQSYVVLEGEFANLFQWEVLHLKEEFSNLCFSVGKCNLLRRESSNGCTPVGECSTGCTPVKGAFHWVYTCKRVFHWCLPVRKRSIGCTPVRKRSTGCTPEGRVFHWMYTCKDSVPLGVHL